MIDKQDKKRLLSNFFSLSLLQGVNYILPLMTFPYLVRVLGMEYFGLLAFATAIITYFSILTDYGFNLTATREISVHRDNKDKVIEIFSAVMSIKFILMLVSFFLLTILVFSFEKFSKDWEIYLLTFGSVVGQVLFPIWFFQGMEKMKYITYLNIVAKVVFTVAIFVFVQEEKDFYLVPLFTSLGFIIVGIWSLWIIDKTFNVKFNFQSFETLKYYLLDGWDIFVSRIFVSLYTVVNIIILGFFTTNTIVGYYAIAEKIVFAISGLFIPLSQTLYPYMAKMYQKNQKNFFKFIQKVSYLFFSIGLILLLILFVFSNTIVSFVVGKESIEVLYLYNILIFTIILTPFGPLFTQVLVIQKLNKEFKNIVKITFLFNIITVPIMIHFYNALGLTLVVVCSQVLVMLLCGREVLKNMNYSEKG